MLHLSFTKRVVVDSFEFNIETKFTTVMKPEWFEDPLVLSAIEEVDGNTVYYGKYRWESPTLGVIGAEQLSGGIKTAIAAYFMPDHYFPLAWMGDNLANTLQSFSEHRDLRFTTGKYLLGFNPDHVIWVDELNKAVKGCNLIDEIVKSGDDRLLNTRVIY